MQNLTLELINWRLFASKKIKLAKQNTLLIGKNGSGKTTLLSALYALYTGQVWPNTTWRQQIQTGQSYFGIKTDDMPGWYMSGLISPQGRIVTRWSSEIPLDWNYKVITYTPDENRWLSLPRTAKLSLFDEALSTIYGKSYREAVTKLEKAVQQKGRLIKIWLEKQEVDALLVQQYHDIISTQSVDVWKWRIKFLREFNSYLPAFNSWIQTNLRTTKIRWYINNGKERKPLEEVVSLPDWQTVWSTEKQVGRVFYGAQRDDVYIEMNEQPAEQFLSRGETRAFLIFFKLFIRNKIAGKVLWLLDDFFNEFDMVREREVLNTLIQEEDWIVASATRSITGFDQQVAMDNFEEAT